MPKPFYSFLAGLVLTLGAFAIWFFALGEAWNSPVGPGW